MAMSPTQSKEAWAGRPAGLSPTRSAIHRIPETTQFDSGLKEV